MLKFCEVSFWAVLIGIALIRTQTALKQGNAAIASLFVIYLYHNYIMNNLVLWFMLSILGNVAYSDDF